LNLWAFRREGERGGKGARLDGHLYAHSGNPSPMKKSREKRGAASLFLPLCLNRALTREEEKGKKGGIPAESPHLHTLYLP